MREVNHRAKTLALSLAVILGSIGLVGARSYSEPAEKLIKGPVVQNVRQDRATLTWVTLHQTGELRRLAEGGGTLVVQEPVYHRMELRGLTPATKYRFNLSREGVDAQVSFSTAPEGDAFFNFVVWGDTRSRHDVHARAVASVLKENPSFVLHTGDLVANGENAEDWNKFFEIEKDLLRNAPFYPVLGNHERNTTLFSRYFAFPEGDGHYYSFDWGNVHIVALDTNDAGETRQMKEAFWRYQLAWLRDDLQRNTKPFTFVFFHHPLYTVIKSRQNNAARLAAMLEPLLLEGAVAAVFNGHDHNYQHHLKSGLHHIVTGGGGAPLYEAEPIPELTLKAAKTENYVRVRMQGAKARVEALDLEGNLIDSFELTSKARTATTAQ